MTVVHGWLFHHLEVSVLRILSLGGLSTISHLSPELAKGSPSVESGVGVGVGVGDLFQTMAANRTKAAQCKE